MAGKKGELIEVSFKPAKGGVISETRSKHKRGGQGGGPDYDYETENAVHSSAEAAGKHLASTMAHCFTGGEHGAPAEKDGED